MSLEHLVPEEGKYSEAKHNSPRRGVSAGGQRSQPRNS